jgi:hypothetical protein
MFVWGRPSIYVFMRRSRKIRKIKKRQENNFLLSFRLVRCCMWIVLAIISPRILRPLKSLLALSIVQLTAFMWDSLASAMETTRKEEFSSY